MGDVRSAIQREASRAVRTVLHETIAEAESDLAPDFEAFRIALRLPRAPEQQAKLSQTHCALHAKLEKFRIGLLAVPFSKIRQTFTRPRPFHPVLSSIVGVAAGAVQGYFGGWTDLLFQRFIEIWTSIPTLSSLDPQIKHPQVKMEQLDGSRSELEIFQDNARTCQD